MLDIRLELHLGKTFWKLLLVEFCSGERGFGSVKVLSKFRSQFPLLYYVLADTFMESSTPVVPAQDVAANVLWSNTV